MPYVASLKIEKVTPGQVQHTSEKRLIEEVTQLTIKAETLPALIEKLGKHVNIIEES